MAIGRTATTSTSAPAMQSPLVSGIVAMVSANQEAVVGSSTKVPSSASAIWRLSDESFLLDFLAVVCSDKASRCFKNRSFQVVRSIEVDAIRSIQCWWQWQKKRRAQKVALPQPKKKCDQQLEEAKLLEQKQIEMQRIQQQQEEEQRLQKLQQEEEQRLQKLQQEEEQRLQKLQQEEEQRLRLEEEQRLQKLQQEEEQRLRQEEEQRLQQEQQRLQEEQERLWIEEIALQQQREQREREEAELERRQMEELRQLQARLHRARMEQVEKVQEEHDSNKDVQILNLESQVDGAVVQDTFAEADHLESHPLTPKQQIVMNESLGMIQLKQELQHLQEEHSKIQDAGSLEDLLDRERILRTPPAPVKPLSPKVNDGDAISQAPTEDTPKAAAQAASPPEEGAERTKALAVAVKDEQRGPLPPPQVPTAPPSEVAMLAEPLPVTASSCSGNRTPQRPPALGAIDSPPRKVASGNTPKSAIAAVAAAKAAGRPISAGREGASSAVNSPAGSQLALCNDKTNTSRGENPYRRKWNPRLAAQQRREREAALGKQKGSADSEATTQRNGAEKSPVSVGPTQKEAENMPPSAERVEAKNLVGVTEGVGTEYGSSKATFSLNAPTDRGPEYLPGERERLRISNEVAAANAVESLHVDESIPPRGASLMAAPSSVSKHPMSMSRGDHISRSAGSGSSQRSPASSATARGTTSLQRAMEEDPAALEGMDFAQIQKLISLGIANAEAGDEPAVEIDRAASAAAGKPWSSMAEGGSVASRAPHQIGESEFSRPRPPAESRSSNPNPCRGESPRGQRFPSAARQGPPAGEEELAGASDAGLSMSAQFSMEPPAPSNKRSMADIRAAAERRRACQSSDYDNGHEQAREVTPAVSSAAVAAPPTAEREISSTTEAPRPMNDIRAIAQRRACGFKSDAGDRTPRSRSRTPLVSSNQVEPDPVGFNEVVSEGPVSRAPSVPRTGGAYRPNHVYSGRHEQGSSARGGRLAESLGLRYGQPPPERT
eukprot:TRINITY_DN4335_c0_g1_i1.p1 TRINITY_DN4335_c0_g1~~TRINITY_DN4335_c0_g1_i1.p1  ORF type:complete len:1004 (-),score=257.32 TRINITY_DN4335_c0_g1_i1:185-3196(-)